MSLSFQGPASCQEENRLPKDFIIKANKYSFLRSWLESFLDGLKKLQKILIVLKGLIRLDFLKEVIFVDFVILDQLLKNGNDLRNEHREVLIIIDNLNENIPEDFIENLRREKLSSLVILLEGSLDVAPHDPGLILMHPRVENQ